MERRTFIQKSTQIGIARFMIGNSGISSYSHSRKKNYGQLKNEETMKIIKRN